MKTTDKQPQQGHLFQVYFLGKIQQKGTEPWECPLFTRGRSLYILLYTDRQPGQTCHSKDGGSAYSIGGGELGWRCETGLKSHCTLTDWCTRREWSVICELHDSYFRLMTIKHAIPRTAEVTHPDGQSWGDIEWTIELLYNSVKTGSQSVLETRSWRQDVVEKASTQQRTRKTQSWWP